MATKLAIGFRTEREKCQAKFFSFICKLMVNEGLGAFRREIRRWISPYSLTEAEELGFGYGADETEGVEDGGGNVAVESYEGYGFGSDGGFAAA